MFSFREVEEDIISIIHLKKKIKNKNNNNIYIYRKEGNVLFNDALNTLYLRLYGVVNDLSDSERGNPMPPHGLLFPISRTAHTTAFVTPVVEH